jgi:hypothetical protein
MTLTGEANALLFDPSHTGKIGVHNAGMDSQNAASYSTVHDEQRRYGDQILVTLENVLYGTKGLDDVFA